MKAAIYEYKAGQAKVGLKVDPQTPADPMVNR